MARVPGSSPSPKKTSKVTKAPSASLPKDDSASAKTARPQPGGSHGPLPTVVKRESLEVKIPYTEEGKLFLTKLQELLRTKELPFKPVCPPNQTAVDPKSSGSGGTTYALELRIEQEGFPPF